RSACSIVRLSTRVARAAARGNGGVFGERAARRRRIGGTSAPSRRSSEMIWLVSLAGFAFLAAGAAVAYAVGAASGLTFFATDNARYLAILPQRVFSRIDVFALMAMPLFILAGEIMNRAGITRALVDLSMALLGRL